MRALILFIFPLVVFGESLSLMTNVSNTNRNTTLSHDANAEVTILSTTLEYASARFGSFQTYFNLREDRVDYSDYLIFDSGGASTPLSTMLDYDVEYYADGSLEFSNKGYTVAVSLFGHLSRSPFKTSGGAIRLSKDFYNKTSRVAFESSLSRTDMPLNYSATAERPSKIDTDYSKIYYQQAFGPNSKGRVSLVTGRRKQDRPRHFGAIVDYGLALSDSFYSQLKLSYMEENTSRSLLDERGYFSLAGAKLQLTYEPTFDFLISLSYGINREIEDDPRTSNKNQVGIDSYGLGIRYLFNSFEVDALGSFSRSNTEAQDYSIGGGVKWLL